MIQVKICGVCRLDDAELALALGATHVGCVIAADSPRRCDRATFAAVRALTRGRAVLVLVVRAVQVTDVQDLYRQCGPDLVQWHGASEAEERTVSATVPLLRVRQIGGPMTALPDTAAASHHRPMLLDGGPGGAGRAFDWTLLQPGGPEHTFVAGGITPDNVASLLAHAPWGIDVASGIESRPGQKDHGAMRALFEALEVRR